MSQKQFGSPYKMQLLIIQAKDLIGDKKKLSNAEKNTDPRFL